MSDLTREELTALVQLIRSAYKKTEKDQLAWEKKHGKKFVPEPGKIDFNVFKLNGLATMERKLIDDYRSKVPGATIEPVTQHVKTSSTGGD
jgi:hypothetical protein